MSYAKNLLSRGEEVVFESRQHWFAILAQTWVFVIGALLAFAVLIWQTSGNDWTLRGYLHLVAAVVLLQNLLLTRLQLLSTPQLCPQTLQ